MLALALLLLRRLRLLRRLPLRLLRRLLRFRLPPARLRASRWFSVGRTSLTASSAASTPTLSATLSRSSSVRLFKGLRLDSWNLLITSGEWGVGC